MTRLPIVVLLSGNGSNLQAIIDAEKNGLPIHISAVISNEKDAFGLVRAQKANIPTHTVAHRDYPSRDAFDADLMHHIDRYAPALVVLAGFMRRLGADCVTHYHQKMINIHPSLLPKYPGLHTHRKVLANQDPIHGTSIHIVTPELDAGPLLCQATLTVRPTDTEADLRQRIQTLEHQLYPLALQWFAEHRISFQGNTLLKDGQAIPKHGLTPLDNHAAHPK